MTQSRFATKFSQEKWKRDLALYEEFQKLTSEPNSSRTEVTTYLMNKYGLHSAASVWNIRKRVDERLKEEGK